MIQRIQSLLLFLAFLLNGGVFFNSLYRHAMDDPKGWIGIAFAIVVTLAALGSLGCIFLYNNRSLQVKGINFLMLVQLIATGFGVGIFVSLGGFGMFLLGESIGVLLLFLAFILQLYSRKKVKDDIELVRSMDRIR